jgi:pentatricopeptide repeat protein
MPPRPFVNDGLWRCLCPGFPPNSTTSAAISQVARRPQRNASPKDGLNSSPRNQLRAYTLSNTCRAANDTFFSQPGIAPTGFQPFGEKSHRPSPFGSRQKPSLAQLPTDVLYEHARAEGAKGNWDEVMNICRVLIKDRGEAPNREMYTAILHSFVSSSHGTAGKLRKVLEEMGFWSERDTSLFGYPKIELDARACECVLEVLAVHPDYLLRSEILEYMKSRWLTLSGRGQNFVVAGLLRERHFEQALDMMEDMVRSSTRVENWVFDEAIWILLEFQEVEEAFYVLGLKESVQNKGSGAGTAKVSDALWGALLDAAAQRQLVRMTRVLHSTRNTVLMQRSMKKRPKCG